MPTLLPRRWTPGTQVSWPSQVLEHNQAIDRIETLEAENATLTRERDFYQHAFKKSEEMLNDQIAKTRAAEARSARLAGALKRLLAVVGDQAVPTCQRADGKFELLGNPVPMIHAMDEANHALADDTSTAPLVTPAKSEALREFVDAWDAGALKPEYDPEGVLADRMWQAVEQLRDATLATPEVREAIRKAANDWYGDDAPGTVDADCSDMPIGAMFAAFRAAGLLDGKD